MTRYCKHCNCPEERHEVTFQACPLPYGGYGLGVGLTDAEYEARYGRKRTFFEPKGTDDADSA